MQLKYCPTSLQPEQQQSFAQACFIFALCSEMFNYNFRVKRQISENQELTAVSLSHLLELTFTGSKIATFSKTVFLSQHNRQAATRIAKLAKNIKFFISKLN